jgi:hydrogenase maturation protease
MSSGRTLVLGVGSPLMGDDGVGVAALSGLRSGWRFDDGVELADGGTWGMTLLPAIETAGRLLIIDAIRSGARPGDLVELGRDALPRGLATKLSPHQIDLREVLALADLRGLLPADAVAIGLEPYRVELDAGLSRQLAARLPALEERVVSRLRSWGHRARRVRPRGNGAGAEDVGAGTESTAPHWACGVAERKGSLGAVARKESLGAVAATTLPAPGEG